MISLTKTKIEILLKLKEELKYNFEKKIDLKQK